MVETGTRRSRLAEKLGQVARGAPSHIGFGAVAERRVPSLVLVAALPAEPSLAEAALSAGADALLLTASDGEPVDSAAFEAVRQMAGDVPLGLALDPSSGEQRWPEWEGIDFWQVPVRSAPASVVQSPHHRLFLSVDLRFPANLLRGLAALPIEGVIVENTRPAGAGLSLEDLLRYRLLADAVSKPLIAAADKSLIAADLVHLRDAGIEGVLVEPAASGQETRAAVSGFRRAIEALGAAPARTRRSWERAVMLPAARPPAAPWVEEPDEDE